MWEGGSGHRALLLEKERNIDTYEYPDIQDGIAEKPEMSRVVQAEKIPRTMRK
jgi:hypothetical protein